MKRKLMNLAKKNVFFREIIRTTRRILRKIKYLKYYLFNKIDNNLVIFESFGGRSFSDSPKALYLEMLRDDTYKNYNFVWAFNDVDSHREMFEGFERTTLVKVNSKEYLKAYSKAKYIIVNSIVNEIIIKKKQQICVQCWHGTPLKRLRCDIEVEGSVLNTIKEIRRRNTRDVKKFNYFISPSKFASEKFNSGFALEKIHNKNIIIEKGYPRNDKLFKYTKEEINSIKEKLHIPKDKKIIMYAPTFRDDDHTSGVGYTYKLGINFDKLKEEIGNDYVVVFRTHYFISNSFDFDKYKGFIYDFSLYEDVNDIYIISDILITDYSSVFFDYANLKRPIIFYMYDLKNYKDNLRGFYLDLNELPGPIVEKESNLIKEIKNIDKYNNRYKDKYIKFNNKFNYLDNENTSKDVLKEIFK